MLVIRLLRLCLVEIPKKNDRNPGNLKSNPHPAVWPRNCPPRVTVRVSPNPANDYTAELQRIWYQKMAPYFEAVVDPPFSKAPILLDIPAVRISVLLMAKNPAFTHSPVGLWEVIYHYLPGFKKGSQVVGLGSSEASTVGPLLLNSTGKSFGTLSNFISLSLQSWSYCGIPLLNYHLMILDACPKIKSDPKAVILW